MHNQEDFPARPAPLSAEALAAQKSRNRMLGWALFGFVILVLVITCVRLATTVMEPGSSFYYNMQGNSDTMPDNGAAQMPGDLPPGMTEEQAAAPEGLETAPTQAETTDGDE